MALGSKQVGEVASANAAAAATYVGGGGHNVASVSRDDVERVDFAHQTGMGDETVLRYRDDATPVVNDKRRKRPSANGPSWRSEYGKVQLLAAANDDSNTTGAILLDQVLRAINFYEKVIQVTAGTDVSTGKVMNLLY